MKTENQSLTGVLPAVSTVPAMKFEAARVRRVDGLEVADYPQPFNSLVDAEQYVADTPVSNDGTRPWIRNATPSPISGSFLMVGAKWLHSEPQGVFKRVPDEVRRTMCCPKTSRHESDVVGCGSTNIIEDPSDPGTFDCLDCGIFFSQEAAEYVEQGKLREGKPSPRFGARGLHNINLGGGSTPLLIKLYGPNNNVLATLTEEKGECIDPGYVDFFLGPNCRPAKHQRYLVEKLPDGTVGVLHDQPQVLARNFDAWVAFLDKWISRHEDTPSRGVVL